MKSKSHEQRSLFNEFYTTAETAERIFRPLLSRFDGKKVCCPCDSENSEIVKWLQKETTCEVIYFSDLDMNGEEALIDYINL